MVRDGVPAVGLGCSGIQRRWVEQLRRILVATLLSACAVCMTSCTPVRGVAHKTHTLTVTVTADSEVKRELDDVEVVVESRTRESNSWRLEESRRFTPDPAAAESGWPLIVTLDEYNSNATYQATATARDAAGAVLIQSRTIADPNVRSAEDLQLRFDRECLRRSALCAKTLTCSFGECVDAHEPPPERHDAGIESATDAGSGMPELGASELEACSADDTRTCARDNELQPLVCEAGMWRKTGMCAEMTRCDSSDGQTHGTCQPIAAECAMRNRGERFCDANGQMFECAANRSALLKPCADNEHCVSSGDVVRCECLFGFVPAAQGCSEPVDCRDMGGCDGQTMCIMQDGERTCSACPPGFSGSGQMGCAPLLSSLKILPGTLHPPFEPETKQYSLQVPLLTQRISIEANSMVDAELLVNNAAAMLGKPWTSSVLAPGQTRLPVTLRVDTGGRTDYQIDVDHTAARQTYIKAAESHAGDWFGAYVSADGDTIVSGAPHETVEGLVNAGAAYVFVREGGTWRQQARLTAPHPASDDWFGVSVTISGDTLVVGRPGDISAIGASTHQCSALVYVRTGGTWSLQQEIDHAANGDGFGFSVVLHGDGLVLGAPLDDDGALNSGAAFVYARSGGSWQLQARLKATTPQTESHFGTMLGFDGNVAAASAWQETVDSNTWAGAVYTFQRNGQDWSLQSRLTAPTVRALAQFGAAISVRGDTLVISAPHNPPQGASNRSGEVHVFKREGADYRAVQVLEAPQPAVADRYGNHVALTSSRLLVGAPGANGSQLGGAYLYARTDDGFVRMADMKAANGDDEDQFGYAVALTDDFAVAAALYEDGGMGGIAGQGSDNSRQDSGSIYVFE